ncbi:MAG: hypothetical protein ABR549_13365 [Mycobacteriales bacterium]
MPTFRIPSYCPRRAVALAAIALATACGGNSTTGSSHEHRGAAPTQTATSSPMPGMSAGEHHVGAGKGLLASEDGYALTPASSTLAVGQQTIRFQVVNPQGSPQTDYVQDQTKLLHFYLVRLDLTGYQHLHPAMANGTWSIDVNVPAPGPYRMYADFVAKDASGQHHPLVLSKVLTAPGRYTPVQLPPPSTTATADGITATMSGAVTAGSESMVTFEVAAGGKPLTDLEPYLESFAHLTALRAEDAAYRHLHPETTAMAGERGGPSLRFSVNFPEKGTWRLFLQVKRAGVLQLLPLTLSVT